MGTIVWGLIVLALAALIIIAQLGIVTLNGTYVLIGLMIGAGAALVVGGLLSARKRDNEPNNTEVLNHGQVFQHRQGPRPETRTGTLAGRRAGRHRGQAQRGRCLRPHRVPGLLLSPAPPSSSTWRAWPILPDQKNSIPLQVLPGPHGHQRILHHGNRPPLREYSRRELSGRGLFRCQSASCVFRPCPPAGGHVVQPAGPVVDGHRLPRWKHEPFHQPGVVAPLMPSPSAASTSPTGCPKAAPSQPLTSLDLTIRAGETYALLGPNGAGKSTTIEMLEGHRKPDSGEVSVLEPGPGRPTRPSAPGSGSSFRKPPTPANFVSPKRCGRWLPVSPRPGQVDEVIDSVGLGGKGGVRISTLSGGQRRRLDVALGIIGNPEVLFLDEPTTGFDPEARRQFWELIRQLSSGGTTIVLTTHYLDEAEQLADRIGVINHGRLIAEGSPQDIGAPASACRASGGGMPPVSAKW